MRPYRWTLTVAAVPPVGAPYLPDMDGCISSEEASFLSCTYDVVRHTVLRGSIQLLGRLGWDKREVS
jgi:hypothetical protein